MWDYILYAGDSIKAEQPEEYDYADAKYRE